MNGRRNHFIYANPCQAPRAAAVSGELSPATQEDFLLCTERLREGPRPRSPPAAAPCIRCACAETPGPGRKPLESES